MSSASVAVAVRAAWPGLSFGRRLGVLVMTQRRMSIAFWIGATTCPTT
jgi:hypothetical protein